MTESLPNDAEKLELVLLQADIDDESPEIIGDFLGRAIAAGALDAVAVPLIMKKGRPGVRVELLATPEQRDELAAMMLRETTTLGVRALQVTRYALARTTKTVSAHGHSIRIKVALWNGRALKAKPEFEDCRAAAEATGKPVREIIELARRIAPEN